MKTKITDIRECLLDGADLVVDFATLGEYGVQVVELECRREPCSPGRVHETTALERRAARLARFAA